MAAKQSRDPILCPQNTGGQSLREQKRTRQAKSKSTNEMIFSQEQWDLDTLVLFSDGDCSLKTH